MSLRAQRTVAAVALAFVLAGTGAFAYFYTKFARRIDSKLKIGPFADSVSMYAAPETVAVGDAIAAKAIAARLRDAGYAPWKNPKAGWYVLEPESIAIFPGANSYLHEPPCVMYFSGGRISRISVGSFDTGSYRLEPRLLTSISDRSRAKRRLVHFSNISPHLVQAVISAEDKHFFRHNGFDLFRIVKAAYVDLKEDRKEQGASTLTMQLVRNLWLNPKKSWKRKAEELLMAVHLEERLSKQQIFQDYANQVYLGRRGTFSVNGFGEGARVFFGKDVSQLTVPEAALLAGIIQRPSYYNPFLYPERALQRRNLVLALMKENGYLTEGQFREATAAPVQLSPGDKESVETQYFVDLVDDELQSRIPDLDLESARVYTTLDESLQRAAHQAVEAGMAKVDAQLKLPARSAKPQVALIALDPRTGKIKALCGGRSYRASQLDHAVAERQPGSAFKPFVYAAAMDTAINGGDKIWTPTSTVVDEPTTFHFGDETYQPGNYHNIFRGRVSLRRALALSLNVATVKVARSVGFDAVVDLARKAGLKGLEPTPAIALGAYDTTPLALAGAYTVFANQGVYLRPAFVSTVRNRGGAVIYRQPDEARRVLDPRVAYLLVSMMKDVFRYGTAKDAAKDGFNIPAAGKTGSSRDGWFAGFTPKLLCVVWVGFDDGHDLGLVGAKSALPIWADFMERALKLRDYGNPGDFTRPEGVIEVKLCAQSGQVATPECPSTKTEVFIDGTQPTARCSLHQPQVAATPASSGGSPAGQQKAWGASPPEVIAH